MEEVKMCIVCEWSERQARLRKLVRFCYGCGRELVTEFDEGLFERRQLSERKFREMLQADIDRKKAEKEAEAEAVKARQEARKADRIAKSREFF
jgi:predicted polyphosphate/ATP-dependent NAD kinase